ncbi:MAG TPA: protein kinase [Thermoanaerobaculia bacterium]|nr:protein kinase [Thermoanaerobaculia bacterium]
MLQPGSRHGRYEIRSLIGAGGMGEVYLAHDSQLQRPVALKVLSGELKNDDELRRRLQQEARAASALNHPNIITVYDVGQLGDEHFIATEYVDGVTLRQRMSRGEPSLADILHIGTQIASALAAAEAAGLVHRDIKPDNIMLRSDGYVKLLDFGLARTMDSAEPAQRTEPFVIRGTVFYMSPEQLRGSVLDSRSDIWSTGVVLYELISGRLPFEGINAAVIAAHILRDDPPPLTRRNGQPVPERLAATVRLTMMKDREQRYASVQELLDDLQRMRSDLERDSMGIDGGEAAQITTTEDLTLNIAPPTNLPLLLTPLVGRDAERDDVVSLMRRDEVRLVTLTGPGGTGKTRLGLAAANTLLHEYDDGVWWISLAPILDARLVASEIAATLDVHEGSASLTEAIRNALQDRTVLLVLDNFEQVLEAAPLIGKILVAAPRVKALVTSRSPLHIHGEREYAVPPLNTLAAVELFVERASAVKSDFTLTPENETAITEICARLDGLPLAIELAAARVKLLPPQAMLSRVEHRLKLLAGGARDLPERQQTMRAAISWGYNLLEDWEKQLFATLSVFRGGFSIEDAERLEGGRTTRPPSAGGRDVRPPYDDVLDGISSLVDKAFLRRDVTSPDDAPRFAMLETIREYGLECLVEQTRHAEIHTEHARLFASIAEECELEVERLAVDEDNFRTALDWATSSGDAELALRLGAALWWYWYVRGMYGEGRRWLDAVLGMPSGGEIPVRAKALTGAGALAFLQCDYDRAIDLLDASIDLARLNGDPVSLARSLQFRGSIARERGEYDHAIDLHLLSRTIWLELEDRANVGRSLNYVGFASWLNNDPMRTFELCDGTLQLFQDRRDTEGVAWSLLNLAAASLYSDRLDNAEKHLEECLAWSRSGGFKEGIAWSLNLLGCVFRARGREEVATSMLRNSLRLHWELGDRWRTASVLEALGGVLRNPRLFGAASALREQLRAPVSPAERTQYDADVAAVGIEECDVAEAIRSVL